MTSPQPYIYEGFYKSLSKLRENHEFEDFEVKVEGEIFTCHSLILASCSDFFAGLLRSNMKEKQEMKVELNNISSSIFRLILNSLYTGCKLLTKKNVLDVWSAVHQLQIQFLIEHCEDFVMKNVSLDTVEMYKQHAEFLQSKKICQYILNFMLKNFGTLREKEIFLRLDFQFLTKLLKCDKLEVITEDLVLDSVFDWVKYGNTLSNKSVAIKAFTGNDSTGAFPHAIHDIGSTQNNEESNQGNSNSKVNNNDSTEEQQIDLVSNQEESNDRKKFLVNLIKATRYCLASKECILRLYKDKLIQNNNLVKDILFQALDFKFCDYLHGHWPTTAIHRNCSNLEHVGVYCDEGEISALSLKQDKWYCIKNLRKLQEIKLTVFKGKLYACSIERIANVIYVLQSNIWKQVSVISHSIKLLLSHENYIYVFGFNEKQMTRFNPKSSPIKLETFAHEIENPAHALSFYNNIVVFSSVDNNGVEETAVHSCNTKTQVWTKLDNLDFLSQNMISFRGDSDTYILDSNGSLWKLKNSEIIEFTFVAKLWSAKYDIRGAVLFRETLFIFGDDPDEVDMLDEVEGVYSFNRLWGTRNTTSNFIHHVISSSELQLENLTEK